MSAMAMVTSKIRIGGLVLCNSYRNPAFLAEMAASLDNISEGRLEIGLGAGWMNEEYEAYGYPFPSGGTRADQLKEGVEILKKMFTEDAASYSGKYYKIEAAHCNPKPVQKPYPPITIGAMAEKKHPALSGNMENQVVTAICRTADRLGIATLRFNFRGVAYFGATIG